MNSNIKRITTIVDVITKSGHNLVLNESLNKKNKF